MFSLLVDGGRKSVTHPVDPPSRQRPVAKTEQGEDASLLPDGTRKTVVSAVDGSEVVPAQSLREHEASINQGRKVFSLKTLPNRTRS